MATLSITLSDSILAAALTEATTRNIPLEVFIESAIRGAISSPTVQPSLQPNRTDNIETLLQSAVSAARSKPAGTKFFVQELCNPQDWESTTPGERKVLGKKFRKIVECQDDWIAKHIDRTASNQAIYQRV